MTTQNLYQKTLNEEMSPSQFLWHVRRDPQYSSIITNTMSFEDTISCLKSKGFIWETANQGSNIKPMDFLGSFKKLTEAATKKQKLKGGKGDKLTPDQVNYFEFTKGWKHELEHTDDIDKAKEIALDHLAEDPMYYTRLQMVEFEKSKKERSDLPIDISKKKASVKDEKNQMTPVKKAKKEKANVSDSGKQEKARSKNAGVKKMKGGSGEMKSISEAKNLMDLFKDIDITKLSSEPEEEPETKKKVSSTASSVEKETSPTSTSSASLEKTDDSDEFAKGSAKVVKIGDKEVYLTGKSGTSFNEKEAGLFKVKLLRNNKTKELSADLNSYKNILLLTKKRGEEDVKNKLYASISPLDAKAKKIVADYDQELKDIEIKKKEDAIKRGEVERQKRTKDSTAKKDKSSLSPNVRMFAINKSTGDVKSFANLAKARVFVASNPQYTFAGDKNTAKVMMRAFKKPETGNLGTGNVEDAPTKPISEYPYLLINNKDKSVVKGFKDGDEAKKEANRLNKESNTKNYEAISKTAAKVRQFIKEEKEKPQSSVVGQQIVFSIQDSENKSAIEQIRDSVAKVSFEEGSKKLTIKMSGGGELVYTPDASGKPIGVYFPEGQQNKELSNTVVSGDTKEPLKKFLDIKYAAPKNVEKGSSTDKMLEDYIRQRIRKALKEGDEGPFIGSSGPEVVKKKLIDYMQRYSPDWNTDPSPKQRAVGAEYQGIIAKLVAELNDQEPGLGTSIYKQYTGKVLRSDQADQATPPPQTLAYDPAKLVSRGGRIAENDSLPSEEDIVRDAKRYNDPKSQEFKDALKNLQMLIQNYGEKGKDLPKKVLDALRQMSDINK